MKAAREASATSKIVRSDIPLMKQRIRLFVDVFVLARRSRSLPTALIEEFTPLFR